MTRIDGRKQDELRPVEIIPNINKFAEGSCLIRCGNTHVLCTASVEDKPPRHVPEGRAGSPPEYSMLPRANPGAVPPGHLKLKLNGRSAEIQRLIGRALRSVVDMKKLGPWNITIDCDVLQGTEGPHRLHHRRLCGHDAGLRKMMEAGQLAEYPVSGYVAAVSAGIVDDTPLLDLCYEEDSAAMVDLNCVMDRPGPPHRDPGHRRGTPLYPGRSSGSWWSCARRASGSFRRSRKRSWAYKQRRNNMKLVLASKKQEKAGWR